MKTTLLLLVSLISFSSFSQHASEKTLESRAREMFRVIQLSDKAAWKKFVKENYSQALIDRPMRQRREQNEAVDEKVNTATTPEAKIEEKAMMFERLHEDFATSKLDGIKVTGQTCEMTLNAPSGTVAVISLKCSPEKPYLLTGFGVEAHN